MGYSKCIKDCTQGYIGLHRLCYEQAELIASKANRSVSLSLLTHSNNERNVSVLLDAFETAHELET